VGVSARWRGDNGGFNLLPARAGGDWGDCPFFMSLFLLSLFLSPSFFVNGFHSLFLSVSHSWRARLCHQGMGTREPGSDRMTFQHLAVCRRSFSLLCFPLSFSTTFIWLWLLTLPLFFLQKKKRKKRFLPLIFEKTESMRCTKCREERRKSRIYLWKRETSLCRE